MRNIRVLTKVLGVKNLISRFRRARELSQLLAASGTEKGAEVYKEAVDYIVPIDTGALVNSAEIETETKRTGASSSVSYGKNVPYAVSVHEDLTLRHGEEFNAKYADRIASGLTHARRSQEQAKFMEHPMLDKGVQQKIYDAIKEQLDVDDLVS